MGATQKTHADDGAPPQANLAFVLALAQALHRYGTPAHRLEALMYRVCDRLGLEARFVATPTAMFGSFGPITELRSTVFGAEPGVMDLERLRRLDQVTEEVIAGKRTSNGGAEEVDRILKAKPRYGPGLALTSFGVAAAAGARLFGGGVKEMAVAGVSSLCIGLMAVLSERAPAVGRVLEGAAGVLASALAVFAALYFGPLSPEIATLAGLIVLLPGLMLTMALSELANQHLIAGTSRLMGAALVFLKLGFGVAVGSRLAALAGESATGVALQTLPGWTEVPALALMTASVCVLFRVAPADFLGVALCGALAYGGGRIGSLALGPELGVFIGALLLGMGSNALARILQRPSVVTLVPGLMLLVPGSIGFRSLFSLLERNVVAGVGAAFSMLMVAVSLVAGLLTANAVLPSRGAL